MMADFPEFNSWHETSLGPTKACHTFNCQLHNKSIQGKIKKHKFNFQLFINVQEIQ